MVVAFGGATLLLALLSAAAAYEALRNRPTPGPGVVQVGIGRAVLTVPENWLAGPVPRGRTSRLALRIPLDAAISDTSAAGRVIAVAISENDLSLPPADRPAAL